jgi:hypothetical protein
MRVEERAKIGATQEQPVVREDLMALALAMPNLASVAAFLASQLASSFSAFLDTHSVASPESFRRRVAREDC